MQQKFFFFFGNEVADDVDDSDDGDYHGRTYVKDGDEPYKSHTAVKEHQFDIFQATWSLLGGVRPPAAVHGQEDTGKDLEIDG